MRPAVSIGLALIFAIAAPLSPQAQDVLRPESVDLRRPTMPVADLDASVTFFTDVLGMEEAGRQIYNSPVLRAAIGAPDGSDITVVALNDRNQMGALVLVNAPGMLIDTRANTANATTLALSTDDIEAVYARVVAGGYQVLMSPEEAAKAEDYPPEKEMIIVEPGGHRLIIVQPPPSTP
jgi:catechol 2,3-dioxygenase-like lactoylglutathione lyase family enzyme